MSVYWLLLVVVSYLAGIGFTFPYILNRGQSIDKRVNEWVAIILLSVFWPVFWPVFWSTYFILLIDEGGE